MPGPVLLYMFKRIEVFQQIYAVNTVIVPLFQAGKLRGQSLSWSHKTGKWQRGDANSASLILELQVRRGVMVA